jgi:class 3 adenylate cyclase/predicted ATPase/tRNA A37 threonylcarbamoyladenosine biosynthesis protein TsaE
LDIDAWLRGIGLAQYAEMFRANDIDIELLGRLTNDDLKDIGVVSFGHRKKLLEAIAELAGTFPVSPQPAGEPKARDAAERRQVTVMFSDLVGSTTLSARIDPEDMREVIAAYQKCVAEAVRRFDGFVAKYLGDGVLAYFGYPEAHEDDAERAVRAGLELIAAVNALKTPASLQSRVGIATGVVVVGDLIGSGEAQERGIVGETPNLAARLQGLAKPNMVVIAEGTRRLLGNLFELEDLGAKDLKGIARPVRVWAALRASAVESRFEALHASGLTALVGREEETELLLRRWSRAKNGEGQVVLLSGEAGIGKSRLTAVLLESIAREPHTRLRYFCSPQHTDSAFYPIIGQMERAAGLLHNDTQQQKLDKLDALLAQTSTSAQDAALIAEMMSLPNDGRSPTLELTPQQRRQRTLEALTAQMEALSQQNPVLMIFEDAHWADPTSLEAFGRVVDRIRTFRVLLLVTFRPEFNAPWVGRPYVTALIINRLTEREASAMIDRIVGNKPLPASIRQDIIERTDGIPLFVEEMTKAVLEAESEGAAEHVAAAVPSAVLAVPASLHASLMARLDRLGGAAKEMAQIGAAIGREFAHALLAAVVPKPEGELGPALDHLIAAGLLFRRGVPPHATYLFKHALVRDAAYGSLLRNQRQRLHALIAAAIETKFPEIVATQPEWLAQHCDEAGWPEKAAQYWRAAGEQAVRRAANVEAIEHFHRALLRNAERSAGIERSRTELAILSQLGPALMSVRGWAAPEVGEILERATNVAQQFETSRDLAAPLTSLWLFRFTRGELDRAEQISVEIFRIARELKDPEIALQAHHVTCPLGMVRGLYSEASKHSEDCIALYDEKRHAYHRYHYIGHDPAVCAMTIGASLKWALGYPAQAVELERNALALARRLHHAPSLAHALFFNAESQLMRRDIIAVAATARELLALCQEHRLAQSGALALIALGCALVRLGEVTEGFARLKEGLAQLNRSGMRAWLPRAKMALAEACLAAGHYDEGLEQVSQAISGTGEIGFWYDLPRLHLLRGELLLHAPGRQIESAESCFRSAFEVAGAQGARGWALRAMTSMARLLAERGERMQAYDFLNPIYVSFTEGFDTLDLKEAKALLDELHA